MSSINENIVKIDKRARELGVALKEKGINKRELWAAEGEGVQLQGLVYEFTPNGNLIRLRITEELTGKLRRVENVSMEYVMHLLDSRSGTQLR